MRLSFRFLMGISLVIGGLLSCVDPIDQTLPSSLDVVVVDGTLTNLAEPQAIRLIRAISDRLTGRPGALPLTKAIVEVIVDSAEVVAAHETTDGTYQLPTGFRGQIGHAYQLRFTLSDGSRYASTHQIMPPVPPIGKVTARFNPRSLPGNYTAAHDFFLDAQDPVDQRNYYRWEWKLWEKQDWCRTCTQGVYSIPNVLTKYDPVGNQYYGVGNMVFENCFVPTPTPYNPIIPYFFYDYRCRTQCWEILYSYELNLFSDVYTNGNAVVNRRVAQIPFYNNNPCLVDIRQTSLTENAYQYFKLLQDQTQNTGGIADSPPTAPIGNVSNVANRNQRTVGFFTASAVAQVHYWLDRKDAQGVSLGGTNPTPTSLMGEELFFALNGRPLNPEPDPPYTGERREPRVIIREGPPRPPTALCVPSGNRTPFKPDGWRD